MKSVLRKDFNNTYFIVKIADFSEVGCCNARNQRFLLLFHYFYKKVYSGN